MQLLEPWTLFVCKISDFLSDALNRYLRQHLLTFLNCLLPGEHTLHKLYNQWLIIILLTLINTQPFLPRSEFKLAGCSVTSLAFFLLCWWGKTFYSKRITKVFCALFEFLGADCTSIELIFLASILLLWVLAADDAEELTEIDAIYFFLKVAELEVVVDHLLGAYLKGWLLLLLNLFCRRRNLRTLRDS